jgi:endonuclease G
VLEVMPEAIGAEAFGDEEELARVSEFLSTVKQIENLTKLNFGKLVRNGDIRSGMERAAPAMSLDPRALNPSPAKKRVGKPAATRGKRARRR